MTSYGIGEANLLTGGDSTDDCPTVYIKLSGTTDLMADLAMLKASKGFTDAEIDAIWDYTDGWKMTLRTTLTTDGVANTRYGICLATVSPATNGAACHIITVSATANEVAAGGHEVKWLTASQWPGTTTALDASIGVTQTVATSGIVYVPDATSAIPSAAAAGDEFVASWFMPTESGSYDTTTSVRNPGYDGMMRYGSNLSVTAYCLLSTGLLEAKDDLSMYAFDSANFNLAVSSVGVALGSLTLLI